MYKVGDILHLEGALCNYYAKVIKCYESDDEQYRAVILMAGTGIKNYIYGSVGVEFDIRDSDVIEKISEEEYLALQVLNG